MTPALWTHLTDRRTSAVRPKKSQAEIDNDKLRRQVERLEKELAKKDAVLGKGAALLELLAESADRTTPSRSISTPPHPS